MDHESGVPDLRGEASRPEELLSTNVTNAASEGLNAKIQRIKKMADGFRNREHFKTAIFFHCGGLDLCARRT